MGPDIATVGGRLQMLRADYQSARILYHTRLTFRAWIKRNPDSVARVTALAAERATKHLRRDYREWVRDWRPGMPIMTGSGRRADWCHIAYLQYALLAQLLHERLQWTGQRVRDAARALQRGMDGGGHEWQPPPEPVPTKEILSVARAPMGRYDENIVSCEETDQREGVPVELAVRRAQWRLWLGRVAAHSWGSYMLDHIIAELRQELSKKTPSLVVGEILRLRGGDQTDYRGCSGCQYLDVVAELSDETHEWLLSRAGSAIPVRIGALAGMHVPFGLLCPPEYDHCLVLGLSYEIRVRSAEWKALDGSAQSRILAGRT